MRDLGEDVNGEVLSMKQCYGSGVPSNNSLSIARDFVKERNSPFSFRMNPNECRERELEFPTTDMFFGDEDRSGLNSDEENCLRELEKRINEHHVGVLLMEIITSHEVKGLRSIFLKSIRNICDKKKVRESFIIYFSTTITENLGSNSAR